MVSLLNQDSDHVSDRASLFVRHVGDALFEPFRQLSAAPIGVVGFLVTGHTSGVIDALSRVCLVPGAPLTPRAAKSRPLAAFKEVTTALLTGLEYALLGSLLTW